MSRLPLYYLHVYSTAGDKDPETYDVSLLSPEVCKTIEADSFWCLQKLLEGIQDNYTLAQPGIQTKILQLKDLVKRLDGWQTATHACDSPSPSIASLDRHLSANSIDYLQFAFRWMNNLLMREFPLHCVVRLWDSYLVSRQERRRSSRLLSLSSL